MTVHSTRLCMAVALTGAALGSTPAHAFTTQLDTPALAGPKATFESPIILVDGGGGDGARVALARRLQKRLRAKAKARGLDPSKIRVDPGSVPYNINGAYAKKTYYNFLTKKQ